MLLEKKVKQEYDQVDRLLEEKTRLTEAVTREQMLKRQKKNAKIQRLQGK